MGSEMAGKTRYLKEKGGRFYARIAVPAALRSVVGASELVTPLGGDRRDAMRLLPEAVANFQKQLNAARPSVPAVVKRSTIGRQLSIEQLAVRSYKDRLLQDAAMREASPGWASMSVDTDHAGLLRDGIAGKLPNRALDDLVGNRIAGLRARGDTNVEPGSPEWRNLAIALCASEYEALERLVERDDGVFDGRPKHPVLRLLDEPEPSPPVDMMDLWDQYVGKRQKEGSMKDGGRRQVLAVKSLIGFTKKSNANDLTVKDISDWQDHLLEQIAVRTIAKVYLPTIRSLFSWAVKKQKMIMNPAMDAKQVAPKLIRNREAGYTLPEALKQLIASRAYQPKLSPRGTALENSKVTAAKRWVPTRADFDLIGRIYEYCIGEFASSEGKRGGEFYTPKSVVDTLIEMIEPMVSAFTATSARRIRTG